MMHKTFEITCQLSPQAASKRLASLLLHEGVRFSTSNLQIASTRTPIAVFGVQPKLYTRKNWVGLNPFAFITSVNAHFEPRGGAIGTQVHLRVNRRRSILFAAFWVLCGFLAGRAMPQPAGAILVAAVVVTAWFGIVSFLGGYLVKKEINDGLKTES